ncbi:MAG: nucleotidyltransferase domain-containing protein [Cyclonatronaceae bacterium]
MFGLKTYEIKQIITVLEEFLEVEEAVLFGTRAMGRYRRNSEVDIALKGRLVNGEVTARVREALSGLPGIPFRFDVVCYSDLENPVLVEHIGRVGQVLYKKKFAGFRLDPDSDYIH